MRNVYWVFAITVCGVAGSVSAADWGNLSGRIVYDGTPPKPPKAKITSDQAECCKHDLVDESLLVNPDNYGVENVIVYLYQNKASRRATEADMKVVPIHDCYKEIESEIVRLDNSKCRFAPRVSLLWTRQTLLVGNSDPIGHNTKIDTRDNPQVNYTIPTGGTRKLQYENPERFPVPVSCSIHPWMKGWVVIRDTPYMAVTDKDGKFEITNLPVGEWRFMFWQEAAGYVSEVKVDGKSESWKRGLKEMTIKAGDNGLGEIIVSPELWKK